LKATYAKEIVFFTQILEQIVNLYFTVDVGVSSRTKFSRIAEETEKHKHKYFKQYS